MDESDDEYHRVFFWQPVIALQKGLYVYEEPADAADSLCEVGHARLEYNFHFRGKPKTVVLEFVTESTLGEFVEDVLRQDDALEEAIFRLRANKS
jgi:hypothetical protein